MVSPLWLFLFLFACGAGLRLFGLLGKHHAERLGTFVFSITLPATILVSLDQVTFSPTAWKLPLAACLVTVPLASIAWLAGRLLALPRPSRGGLALAVGSINSVYFAFPVMLATFGEEGLAQAILFDLGQTTLTLTVLYPMALRHGSGSTSSVHIGRRLITSPPLWALATIALMKIGEFHLPDVLRS
ncbi:MAG: AEC family transporter, partial [Nitrospira sp.]|nr:AEC family transporter [Nitrospira sp.]